MEINKNTRTGINHMNIVRKFQVNTEDFKIYFDNDKKTHVAENIEKIRSML